ncbi:aconitate hydratase AcnA [Propionivibrio dicarboxylicus]|uniref:Aconitate hydratase n=1 Tax=Propionivibrio dicarboxylicus TaxID=83767 RepID=A0A1G8J2Z0_9RHOO|nr:aconitate hydratase AcnA [Propionivibrio dicarboxylicus]SDI25668.1 aconitate hydratase [Propionivibrio dicarboxylicus]
MSRTAELRSSGKSYRIIDLPAETGQALAGLPWILRILFENVLRKCADEAAILRTKAALVDWLKAGTSEEEIEFYPTRVLMHDTTCGPALADIAAMRSVLAEEGGDPALLNPVLPVDVSTDHSLPVDFFATPDAMQQNMAAEMRRNAERYRFAKWASTTLKGLRVHPPGTGIMHTINLERLATVVSAREIDGQCWAYPDTLIGTDSHTPMINGIGVLAWGVGGLEAESVIFDMPVMLRIPDIVGVRLSGRLPEGTTATDLALLVTQRLRQSDLSGKFVEFYGPGVSTLSAGARACIANMAPEYGASSGYFPVDDNTLAYLRATGRTPEQIALVGDYAKRQQLWFDPLATPRYSDHVEIDLDAVVPGIAGPRRPQDRIPLGDTASALRRAGKRDTLRHFDAQTPPDGAVAIAAITSCTNTSDPELLLAAGLLARKAHAAGLKPPHWVKTSMAPGSPSAYRYLSRSGLLPELEAVGFGIVGYGCTTCIGNSGALTPPVIDAVNRHGIVPVVVLSGNRNFPGRVHPDLDAGFITSPPLVIAYALAGDVNRDIRTEPLGLGRDGQAVYLADIWPSSAEIQDALARAIDPADIAIAYDAAEASPAWQALDAPGSTVFPWDPASTYIRRPPFASARLPSRLGNYSATVLLAVGDDMTTDHISPVGQIPAASDAGRYLIAQGDDPDDLNVYASRRANWEAMVRGLFTNKSVVNLLDPSLPAGKTRYQPTGESMSLFDAAQRYEKDGSSVVIVAGERYGMGSSRDWAAKGAGLLNARAILAVGFERIHRSNLIGMGVLPVKLPAGVTPASLALGFDDSIEVAAPAENFVPRMTIPVRIVRKDGSVSTFAGTAAVETSLEVAQLRAGGIIPYILQRVMAR